MQTDFKEWLRGRLKATKMTHEAIADHLGVTRSSVTNWVTGYGTGPFINPVAMYKLCKLCGCSLEEMAYAYMGKPLYPQEEQEEIQKETEMTEESTAENFVGDVETIEGCLRSFKEVENGFEITLEINNNPFLLSLDLDKQSMYVLECFLKTNLGSPIRFVVDEQRTRIVGENTAIEALTHV